MEFKEPIETLIADPRRFTRDVKFPPSEQLQIYDTSLRDGEQMPGVAYTPEQKYEICRRLSDIGVHIMDVGFPAVSADERRALQLIMQGKRKGEVRQSLDVVVMCRSNTQDIDATLQALAEIAVAPSEVTFFIFTSGSDLHMKYKIGKALLAREGKPQSEWLDLPLSFYRAANVRMQCDAIAYARRNGVRSIEFGGEDGSRGDVDYFIHLFKEGLKAGGTRPSWPDTVGCLTPEATRWYCERIVQALPRDTTLLNHFHNDYGLGTINCITSLACGFKAFTVTANGYGERAGNVPLHQVVTALRVLYGVEIPGFKYEKLRELARFMESVSGIPVAAHEPVIGANVFSHESGIHTHAMLIDRRMYEAVPSELVGARMRFVFGKHSGISVIDATLRKHEAELARHGVRLEAGLSKRVLEQVKRVREERARTGQVADAVNQYYENMERLGLTESDVVQIAEGLGNPSVAAAG
jgi:isopropylmalate/homocitrate/citramalate synthase